MIPPKKNRTGTTHSNGCTRWPEPVGDHAGNLDPAVGDHVQGISVVTTLQAKSAKKGQFVIVQGLRRL